MNNNSSRFGKYLELRFDTSGTIMGAVLSNYLLEKSRVAVRNDQEQNFHIFYQLFAGLNADGKLPEFELSRPSDFHYLRGPNAPSDVNILTGNFKQEWDEVLEGLHFLGFEKRLTDSLVNALAAVLHIGNVTFDFDGTGVTLTGNPASRQAVARLIKVGPGRWSGCPSPLPGTPAPRAHETPPSQCRLPIPIPIINRPQNKRST